MTPEELKARIDREFAMIVSFDNWHGITAENLHAHRMEPFAVAVDPDDGIGGAGRTMWLALKETRPDGYFIGFDPSDNSWGVVETTKNAEWVLVVGADTLAGALSAM